MIETWWNDNLSEAPKYKPIWAASACGQVVKTFWVESGQHWIGFPKTPPIAWQPYHKPRHPHEGAT